MLDLKRVTDDISNVGLYAALLDEIKTELGDGELLSFLESHSDFLDKYREINLDNNISNIHQEPLAFGNDETKNLVVTKINQNLQKMRELEKYTIDFENSPVLIFIMSAEFFLLFSVQYMIVLLDLEKLQWYIYASFLLSIVGAWAYAKKEKKRYAANALDYKLLYTETLETLTEHNKFNKYR